jgi:PTH1 family peptidyl-tRNA hydrolase
LSGFSKENQPLIEGSIDKAVEATIDFIEKNDFIATMNRFN